MGSLAFARFKRPLTFVVGGALNTGLSYGVYLLLLLILDYQVAYFFAYLCGLLFAYWFNAVVVFKVALSWRGLMAYPIVYIVQYVLSATVLGGLVAFAGLAEAYAPLVVAAVMLPVTYLMNKFVLGVRQPKATSGV
jgi:putative flippase GtrA